MQRNAPPSIDKRSHVLDQMRLQTTGIGKDDIFASLASFLGQAPHPDLIKNYTDNHAANLSFPDAFVGSNNYLRETMTNLVLENQQDFMTTHVLPWRHVEGVEVKWDVCKFDVRLLAQVPYEGVSRMQTSERETQSAAVVRRGIAMQIESDFFLTEAGRQHFKDHLMSIRMAVQETSNFDGLFSLLACPNYPFHYSLSHGLIPSRSVISAMRHNISMFGIVQKEQRGFERAVETAKTRMQSYHATADTLIIAPELSLYITTVPEARIDYCKAGQPGVDEFQKGSIGFGESKFRGMAVHKVLPFDLGEQGARTQMLSRVVQTGEFFRMPSGVDEILIFDEDTDSLKTVSRKDALVSIFGWNKTGVDLDKAKQDVQDKIKSKDPSVTGDLTILRPWIEHDMLSAIMTKAGADTGLTLFGPSDMQISSHTATKMIEGHYTCHTKSVVTKPENVCVMENLMCTGYGGGGGVDFFMSKQDVDARHEMGTTEGSSQKGNPKSLLAVLGGTKDDFCSITGQGVPWSNSDEKTFPGGNKQMEERTADWNLENIYVTNDTDAAAQQSFLSNGLQRNSMLFVGSHRYKSDTTHVHVVGQGHFGGDSLPGDARWRRGEAVDMISARAAICTDKSLIFSYLEEKKRTS